MQAANIVLGLTNVLLLNIYIPSTTSNSSGYSANIEYLFIAHDDFNAHHHLWHYIQEENHCIQRKFGIWQTKLMTDITIASPTLFLCTEWATQPALSSYQY